jgi:hypothetical protein
MQKKVSLMNQVVVQNAALPEKLKADQVVAILVSKEKCSLQYVQLVEKKLQFLSSLQVKSQFTAVTVTNHVHATIGKIS